MTDENDTDALDEALLSPEYLSKLFAEQNAQWVDAARARSTRKFDPGPSWIPDVGISFDAPPKVSLKDLSPEMLHAAGLRTADEVVSDALSLGSSGSSPGGSPDNEPFKKLPGANL